MKNFKFFKDLPARAAENYRHMQSMDKVVWALWVGMGLVSWQVYKDTKNGRDFEVPKHWVMMGGVPMPSPALKSFEKYLSHEHQDEAEGESSKLTHKHG